jgi:serine-threonine kinase receptor-associated protein
MASYTNGYSYTPQPGLGGLNGQSSGLGNGIRNGNGNNNGPPAGPAGNNIKVQPLLCSGHTRPVVHLQFSNLWVGILYLSRYTDQAGR